MISIGPPLRWMLVGAVLLVSAACPREEKNEATPSPTVTEEVQMLPPVMSPAMAPGAPSFFSDQDAEEIYVGLITGANGARTPFSWDCDGSLIAFLHRREKKTDMKFTATHGAQADPKYLGTKIAFAGVPATLLRDGKVGRMTVESWRRIDPAKSECGKNTVYPSVHFRLPRPVSGFGREIAESEGVYFVALEAGAEKRFEKLSGTPKPHVRTTTTGEPLEGLGLDTDGDERVDLFWYYESLTETSGYLRLYMNVTGVWHLRWIYHHEACV